jgi:L-aminopeptidase/D-esterase-like protein
LDGDTVFALATGGQALEDPVRDLALLGGHAANCLGRAIARGVYEAESLGEMVGYQECFPK